MPTTDAIQTELEIIGSIKTFIAERGGQWADWYVGITKDIACRLFRDHRVSVHENTWIWCEAANSESARAVEIHFLILGCDGGPGGGDATSKFIYAYQRTSQTRP